MGRLLSFKAHREGAFSWLPPAALLAALAMLLITMGTAPSAAEESPDPETGIRVEGSESENTGEGEERPPGKKTLEQNKVGDADPEVPAPEGRGEEDAESGGFFGSLINAVQSLILAPFAANNDIVVNIESHEKIGAGTDIFIGDTVKITGTWDARNANPRAGDTFRIDFGSQFKVDGVSVDLPGPEQSTGEILNWGTCLPAGENSLECTLTDSVEGRENIHGTWGATVTAISVGELVEDAGVRIDSKRGTMLYDPVTLGGVTHPAGTVTWWEIKISGDRLVNNPEPITITDIFDPKLQVCEAEGDLRSALGMDAERPDSVMQTVLDEVQHHAGENTLTFRILPPAGGYPPLSEPTLRYYLCTTSGGMDAAGSTYENLAHTGEDGPTISAKITQDRSYVGTGTGVNRGSFSLRKVLAEDSEQPDFGQIENSFTVKYEEFTLDAYAAGEDPEYVGQLNISADGEAVSGIHARGSGWIIRLSEIQFPEVPGMKWENPVFTGGENLTYETEGDPSVALVTTGPGSNVEVLLSNNLQPFEPWIGTTAEVTGAEDKLLPITGGEVVDTVAYRDLVPETEYRLEGEIMHVALDGRVTPTGVQATATFTTPERADDSEYVSGTTEVLFQIDGPTAQRYAGEKLVVFERLFNPAGENPEEPVATHEDPEDEAQSFQVEEEAPEDDPEDPEEPEETPTPTPEAPEPWIGTTAEVTGDAPKLLPLTGGEVVDTVAYRDLKPGTEYLLEGEIMHVAPDGTVTSTGVQATATFTTPESADDSGYVSGTTEVTFQIDGPTAQRYAGEKLVVFEKLFNPAAENPEKPVATHEDPEDAAQSFQVEEEPGEEIIITKTVTGPKGREIEADPDAVFQIRASWTDAAGEEHSELINVTLGEPTSLRGLPANTEITLSEVGAATGVSNVRWGDVRWSGEGVVDAQEGSRDATVILSEENSPLQVSLENRTSSNGLILIPLPIPLPPGDGPAGPPSPDTPDLPDAPGSGKVVPETPVHHGEPAGMTPTVPAEPTAPTPGGKEPVSGALASTGANVGWVAGGALLLLLAGAVLFLRGRELKS